MKKIVCSQNGLHPALKWFHQDSDGNNNNENNNGFGYWSLPNHIVPTTLKRTSSLSYEQVFNILEPFIQTLSQHIEQQRERQQCSPLRQQQQQQQPIIAISIPEGPLLPIAVLAVHLLNVLGTENDDTKMKDNYCYAPPIILPLDPQEGIDRLKHMIGDAKPCIILYVKDTLDGKKMENIVQSLLPSSCFGNDDEMPETGPKAKQIMEPPPQLLDMITLLKSEPSLPFTVKLSTTMNHTIHSNRISHIVYTSGTTGVPKGTISSIISLLNYTNAKNISHNVSNKSKVFLASSLSFDPCLSDIIATFYSGGCLCLCSKEKMKMDLGYVLSVLDVTHVLCTPSLWNSVNITKTAVATHTNDNVTTNTITHNATNDNCDHELDTDKDNDLLNCLEVVALGGEVMSGRIKGCWARTRRIISSTKSAEEVDICDDKSNRIIKNGSVRLLSTYGVTEACVYQTVGEVFIEEDNVERDNSVGYDIGSPMEGTKVRICKESNIVGNSDAEENVLVDVDETTNGEIVLSGNQLDEYSGYLNLPELTKKKFIQVKSNRCVEYFYRTGDRGLINPNSGRVHILGRIDGEEGMIKISGVRVELGEIEHAILDSESFSSSSASRPMVIGCIVVAHTVNEDGDKKLVAYCVLSDDCLKEMGITEFKNEDQGLLCSPGSLVAVLRARCEQAIRKECIPSTYVLIPRIPLTRTGKRNRKALPKLESCQLIDSFINGPGDSTSIRLDKYGRCGKFVYNILIECLNLQSKQRDIVTTKANFAMLGGDSLGATLVVRTLYATHHEVNNSRHLGGSFGSFDGPFHVCHLLQSMTLGDYIDFLDSNGVIDKAETAEIDLELNKVGTTDVTNGNQNKELLLYESLVEAITLGQSIVAASLISVGADPNYDDHGRRLGKMKNGRKEQKRLLKSNPLHLACVKGDQYLVSALLNSGCNCKSPDAAGQYPLHLACSGGASGVHDMDQVNEQDTRRLECVRLLLEVGKAPLAMKNVSKQTVLHCAARAGHCRLLKYLMDTWGNNETIKANKLWGSKFDWQDRWFRTPVHWAVLNGKVAALKLLLEYCSPNPPLPKQSSKRSSVATESPLQICERLYDIESDIGKEIRQLLTNSR